MAPHARLFIALTPPPAVREQLAALRNDARARFGGKPVPDDNLHLTLVFLGQTPLARVDELTGLIDHVDFFPLNLQLDQLGSFAKAQVVWVGLSARHIALEGLVQRLQHDLKAGGFSFDKRPFNAHITLLRKAVCAPELLVPPIDWQAAQLSLYESRSTAQGVEYWVLDRTLSR